MMTSDSMTDHSQSRGVDRRADAAPGATAQFAVLIAGPTASGKSAVALSLARRVGGAIINADSMQVYAGLRLLSARPSEAEERQAPHLLYGHVAPERRYSVADWLSEATEALQKCRVQGWMPIIVGGTGLYFKALLEGLSPVPPIPEPIRLHWRAEARKLGPAGLHAVLAGRDPVMAERLPPSDPQRLARALEVLEATGRSLADWQAQPGQGVLVREDVACAVLAPDRGWLHERINRRFDRMMEEGALDEARAFAGRGLDPALSSMRAIGVQHLAQAGDEAALEAAVMQSKTDSRRYAKRQETWFRNQMPDWPRFDPGREHAQALALHLAASLNS